MINPKTGFCVVICALRLHFLVSTLNSLLLVNLNADSNAAAVRTVSEDKKTEKMQVLDGVHLNETINVNNLSLVSQYPSHKHLTLQIKH